MVIKINKNVKKIEYIQPAIIYEVGENEVKSIYVNTAEGFMEITYENTRKVDIVPIHEPIEVILPDEREYTYPVSDLSVEDRINERDKYKKSLEN
jgi:hypothetical protein